MSLDPFPLYHWSPTARRKQITRQGLTPGKWSPDRLWKPPCICYADSPVLAWGLCIPFREGIDSWDLWMTWSNAPSGYEQIPFDDGGPASGRIKEYRVYERIYKRDLAYVATRTARPLPPLPHPAPLGNGAPA